MSYGITRRTSEIGIRVALGAPRSRVFWMILRDGLFFAATGLALGIPIAFAAGRLVTGMLFGVRPADPTTMIAAAALLVVLNVAAGYLPRPGARQESDPLCGLALRVRVTHVLVAEHPLTFRSSYRFALLCCLHRVLHPSPTRVDPIIACGYRLAAGPFALLPDSRVISPRFVEIRCPIT